MRYLLWSLLVLIAFRSEESRLLGASSSIIISGGKYSVASGDDLGGSCIQDIRPIYNGKDLKKIRIKSLGSCSKLGRINLSCQNNSCSVRFAKFSLKVVDNETYDFTQKNPKTTTRFKFRGVVINPCSKLNGGSWVRIGANSSVGQSKDFCVMKYEASKDGSKPQSKVGKLPWTRVNRMEARTACLQLGPRYDLISNAQWQALAREIETARKGSKLLNWRNGNSSFYLNVGNSNLRNPRPTNSKENKPWSYRRRFFVTKSGDRIWDVSGNVWEWVKDNILVSQRAKLIRISALPPNLIKSFGPSGKYAKGRSPYYRGLGVAYLRSAKGIIRGGGNGSNASAGIFTVNLRGSLSFKSAALGFRCVYELRK